jgi:hypothetical protein
LSASVAAFVLASCGVAPPHATPGDAARAHVELHALERGRTLLLAKCGGCHRPPMPLDRAVYDWPRELDDMGVRAHLDREQRQLIEQYLITLATR